MTKKTRTLGAIFHNKFELLDVYGPLEMFGNLGSYLNIVTVAQEAGPVRSTQGPQTVAEYSFDDCPPLDLILLPGGSGTIPELQNEAMLSFLRDRSATAEIVMSVCTGSALLAKAGVLDGKRATSNKMYFSLATDQSDQVDWVEEARWVEDGRFVTASGVSAGTDMSLAVIARLWGEAIAQRITIATEYEWQSDADRDPFVKYLNQGTNL